MTEPGKVKSFLANRACHRGATETRGRSLVTSMPKIIKSVSGSDLSEEPFESAFGPSLPQNPSPPAVERKEVVVTPEPKTRRQARANKKAERLAQAQKRQVQNAYARLKPIGRAKRAARKRKR